MTFLNCIGIVFWTIYIRWVSQPCLSSSHLHSERA